MGGEEEGGLVKQDEKSLIQKKNFSSGNDFHTVCTVCQEPFNSFMLSNPYHRQGPKRSFS